MAKIEILKYGDLELKLEVGSLDHRRILKMVEDAHELAMAEFVTAACNKLAKGYREVYATLTEEEQIALVNKTHKIDYNGRRLDSIGLFQTRKVKIVQRERKPKITEEEV